MLWVSTRKHSYHHWLQLSEEDICPCSLTDLSYCKLSPPLQGKASLCDTDLSEAVQLYTWGGYFALSPVRADLTPGSMGIKYDCPGIPRVLITQWSLFTSYMTLGLLGFTGPHKEAGGL